jgi:DNA-binding MarR family transcriptional regulator
MPRRHADAIGTNRGDESWDKPQAIGMLFDECVLLYLRLTALAAKIHHKGPLSGPRRTVLVSLARSGPETVAQMARRRAQSRQRFQPLVKALIAEGLLQALPNAAHKQSPLIALTPRGRTAVERFHKIEQQGRSRLKIAAKATAIGESVAVIREVRVALEGVLADLPQPRRRPTARR